MYPCLLQRRSPHPGQPRSVLVPGRIGDNFKSTWRQWIPVSSTTTVVENTAVASFIISLVLIILTSTGLARLQGTLLQGQLKALHLTVAMIMAVPIATPKRRASPMSSAEPTSTGLGGNKRLGQEIDWIRNGLAQAVFKLDPWDWDVEAVVFALTDKRSVDVMYNSSFPIPSFALNGPALASLGQPFPSVSASGRKTLMLRDLIVKHNISGRVLLEKFDEAVLRRYDLSAGGAQQALLLSHVASLRRRSVGYRAFIRSKGELRPVVEDTRPILSYLRRCPLVKGQQKSFGFPTHRLP
ncbi:MAG: hypothetical protein L6R39_002821 [Caloplaca ligustica]|nr:MAG: hypothetical protein L6R39_002821 [Caloplaca ligustica]